ncbi:hypothetical protein SpCBS45565_g02976 [Spizellomyces sp. 'palustris']|nr:hypothetical protein SpCBS45565_g02976 [Spizellomyces sp. 'palustris']
MVDILAGLKAELAEFDEFVDSYTTKMNEILSGKVTDEERAWAQNELTQDNKSDLATSRSDADNRAPLRLPKRHSRGPLESPKLDYSKWDAINPDAEEEEECIALAAEKRGSTKQQHEPTKRVTAADKIRQSANQHREAGNKYFKDRKYHKAIEEYTAAINIFLNPPQESDPLLLTLDRLIPSKTLVDATLFTNRALAYLRLKEFKQAVEDCSEAVKVDASCAKALWRRAEGYRGLRQYAEAIKDVLKVKQMVTDYEAAKRKNNRCKKAVCNPGVTLAEVDRLLDAIEREHLDLKAEEALKEDLEHDGSNMIMEGLVDGFVREIKNAAELPPSNKVNDRIVSASDMLVRLLDADTIVSDAFRLCGGFHRLLNPDILTSSSVNFVLPVIARATSRVEANRRELCQYLNHMITTMLATQKPPLKTISAAAEILSSGVAEDTFAEALCQSNVVGETFGRFVLAFLGGETDGVATSSTIVGHMLKLLGRIMRYTLKGPDIVMVKWQISPDKLLATLPIHLKEYKLANDETTEALTVHACRCIDAIAGTSNPKFTSALKQYHEPLIDSIWETIHRLSPTNSTSTASTLILHLLATYHNLLHKTPAHPTLLSTHSIITTLIHLLTTQPRASISCLAKLLRFHSEEVTVALDGWWDIVPMISLIRDPAGDGTRTAAAQVLAAWLKGGERRVAEWEMQNGFEALVYVLLELSEGQELKEDEKTAGNIGLCIAECATKANHAKTLHKLNATEPLVYLLRSAKLPTVQRNLAIACARLCQNSDALSRVRELKGVELMYSLGTKIL